jgi:RNA polymerase sigma-B factor
MITRTAGSQPTTEDSNDLAGKTSDLLRSARTAGPTERREYLQQVVLLHLDLAESVARRYHGRGIDAADLDQVARLALVEAAGRADPDRGDFRAYAISTIRGRLKRHFRDHGWMVRPPRRVQELQAKVVDQWSTLSQQEGTAPTVRQLAQSLGESAKDVAEACDAGTCFHPTSLDAPRPGTDGSATLGALLGRTDPQFARIETAGALRSAMVTLAPEDQRILWLRFFEQKTQQQIADEIGVSQMQISRSLRRILTGLRKHLDQVGIEEQKPRFVAA